MFYRVPKSIHTQTHEDTNMYVCKYTKAYWLIVPLNFRAVLMLNAFEFLSSQGLSLKEWGTSPDPIISFWVVLSIVKLRVCKLQEASHPERDAGTACCGLGELNRPNLGLQFIGSQDDWL